MNQKHEDIFVSSLPPPPLFFFLKILVCMESVE